MNTLTRLSIKGSICHCYLENIIIAINNNINSLQISIHTLPSSNKSQIATMVKITTQTAIVAILGSSAVQGCDIPKANAASVNLVGEFEGWRPDVCT